MSRSADERLSTGMRRIKGRYARSFNDRHTRTGHLFQGRFEAYVIRDEEHLANSCAYVWNNPVRAGLREEASDWPWSGSF
jgi:putative transposase